MCHVLVTGWKTFLLKLEQSRGVETCKILKQSILVGFTRKIAVHSMKVNQRDIIIFQEMIASVLTALKIKNIKSVIFFSFC